MKKAVLSCTVLLLAALLGMPCGSAPYQNVFRLHVIANSDSVEDQQVKLLVRDSILALERERMASAANGAAAEMLLMEDGKALLGAAEDTLQKAGMDYGASLFVGRFPFPERSYGGKVYPAGEYQALRVVLGEGKGQNWWCVMFPPLCILEGDAGEIDVEKLRENSFLLELLKHIEGGTLWDTIKEKLQ
ncbi:MAG: stage II sporulation protein R [Clostridiales bacterium]|nr:stage II sporulation protein R [Clostridiales bacterium]